MRNGSGRQRTAGLRTNALVSAGAAAFVLVASLGNHPGGQFRIAAQVVSGIGFIGAGVIFREGLSINGLNTAATLWCSAAIGVLCGSGLLILGKSGWRISERFLPGYLPRGQVDPAVTMKVLRHKRLATTLEIYSHQVSDQQQAAQGLYLEAVKKLKPASESFSDCGLDHGLE